MTDVVCFHCHETVPTKAEFKAVIAGVTQPFCCAGCMAIAQTIESQGLADYYKFRTKAASKAEAIPAELKAQLASYDSPAILAEISERTEQGQRIALSVQGMSCAACAWLIEKQLSQNPAVHAIKVNSSTARCELVWHSENTPLSELLAQFNALGYQASPFVADQEEAQFNQELSAYLRRLAVAGIMTMQVMMLAFGLYFGEFSGIEAQYEGYLRWVSLLLTLPVMAYSAKPFFQSAYRALRVGELNMDFPISLALLYTFLASCYATFFDTGEVYFESVCMFVFLLQLGKFFEFRARKKARDATSNLLKILPVSAHQWQHEQLVTVSARSLVAGDRILVKAGETIPADGIVESGQSSADESMLTGEYRPISKQPLDSVLAGSVNHDGLLTIKVAHALTESRLGQIIALQQQTLMQKPEILAQTDKIARFFIQRLLVVAALTFVAWYWFIDADRAFWVTLSVLVATCPCALSLATPTAITCALAQLNKQGLLIKNQHVLHFLPKLNHVFFDKTGTLTQGRFSVANCHVFDNRWSEESILAIIASAERHSEHPIARAFSPYLTDSVQVQAVELAVGHGLYALYQQQKMRIGSAAFCQVPADLWLEGAPVWFTVDDKVVAAVQLTDQLRPEVPRLLQQLAQTGLKLSIVTGDSSGHGEQLAQSLGLDHVYTGCSPEQKVAVITQAVAQGDTVMMVGDGINDSPCFHAAQVSVALDSGTALSKNQADVVLLHNDLQQLQLLFTGARQTRRVIQQNLWWAALYNLIIIPLAVCGFVSPYVAVIGMSCSSLLVVSNSLRLLKS